MRTSKLDLVLINVIYHDTTYLDVDRDQMNKAVFDALKPGGAYVVIDSSAKPGTGTADGKTLHRIDEQAVRTEVERAGSSSNPKATSCATRRTRGTGTRPLGPPRRPGGAGRATVSRSGS